MFYTEQEIGVVLTLELTTIFLKIYKEKSIYFQFKPGKLYTFLKKISGKFKVKFKFSWKNEFSSLWQPCF